MSTENPWEKYFRIKPATLPSKDQVERGLGNSPVTSMRGLIDLFNVWTNKKPSTATDRKSVV